MLLEFRVVMEASAPAMHLYDILPFGTFFRGACRNRDMVPWRLEEVHSPNRQECGFQVGLAGFDAGPRAIGWLAEYASARAEEPEIHDFVAG